VDYTQILSVCDESRYLISMVPVERIVELGYNMGISASTRVLDLGCGYGTMLKIWSEAFGISGVGVDREKEFIEVGKARLSYAGASDGASGDCVQLVTGDIFELDDSDKYDLVVCTECSLSAEGYDVPFSTLSDAIRYFERFLKPNGKVIFGRLYSKVDNPPKELTDFDGELPTLSEIYDEVRACGYYITAMATDTVAQWENYITWSARRDLVKLRANAQDTGLSTWIDTWYHMYFDYRRQYEGWGLFGIERL